MYFRIGVKFVDLADDFVEGNVFGEVQVEGLNTNFSACLPLHAHIALRILPVPNYHHSQPRNLINFNKNPLHQISITTLISN